MPHPAQVTHEQILHTARRLFEAQGYEQVTLARLAEALGIKAPSLYKHFSDKAALLKAVNTLTMSELTHAMQKATLEFSTPYARAEAMASAYWDYALAHPAAYSLAFNNQLGSAPDPAVAEALALPLQAIFAEGVGAENALTALRGAWALLHGFVMLYLTERFQRGGDVTQAYQSALRAYLRGWGIDN